MERLSCIKLLSSKSRPLIDTTLLLLSYCSKLKICREALIERHLVFLNKMLQMLNMCIAAQETPLVEDILTIVNRVLAEAALNSQEMDTGDKEELTTLLNAIDSEFVQSRPTIIHSLMEMIPFLSFGDEQFSMNSDRMTTLPQTNTKFTSSHSATLSRDLSQKIREAVT